MSTQDEMPLRKIDHVRFFVGNARKSAYFYRNAYGLDVVAYAGLETKVKHEAGYVLQQGGITFVIMSPLRASHPDASRLILHGDGVSDIALQVDDVHRAYNLAVERGAVGVLGPRVIEDKYGVYEFASLRAYGDTTHTFVNRDRYKGAFAPGFDPIDPARYNPATYHPTGLLGIDHMVGNVEEGRMNEWVKFYRKVLEANGEYVINGSTEKHADLINTEVPFALECKVLQIVPVGHGPISANLIIGEIVTMHIDDAVLDPNGQPDPRKLKAIARLGGEFWCRTQDLFQLERP